MNYVELLAAYDKLEAEHCMVLESVVLDAETIHRLESELAALKASLKKQLDQCTECAEVYAERDALKDKAAVPDGWKLVSVNASFSDLMYYLDRASVKGYLDRLYDLVEPWETFDYEYIENAAAPAQPQSDGVMVPRELLMELRDSANEAGNLSYRQHHIDYHKRLVRQTDSLLGGSHDPAL